MEIECPNCGFDDCYFNGTCYECPDCGCTWTDNDDDENDCWNNHYSVMNYLFEDQ